MHVSSLRPLRTVKNSCDLSCMSLNESISHKNDPQCGEHNVWARLLQPRSAGTRPDRGAHARERWATLLDSVAPVRIRHHAASRPHRSHTRTDIPVRRRRCYAARQHEAAVQCRCHHGDLQRATYSVPRMVLVREMCPLYGHHASVHILMA